MSKRKYTHIQELEEEILRMRQEGGTRQEIADRLGLNKSQIKNWITRYNRRQAKLAAGIQPRPKGRPRKNDTPRDIVAEQAYEIRRLRMENELLRDFLQTSCCGIFCNPQEGGESKGEVCSHLPSSGTVSGSCHV